MSPFFGDPSWHLLQLEVRDQTCFLVEEELHLPASHQLQRRAVGQDDPSAVFAVLPHLSQSPFDLALVVAVDEQQNPIIAGQRPFAPTWTAGPVNLNSTGLGSDPLVTPVCASTPTRTRAGA